MAAVSVEHVNIFLVAAGKILKDMCQIDAKIGKPMLRDAAFTEESIVIIVGLTGQMRGQVMIDLEFNTACNIASKMCMMPITEMNEISLSALSELGNMIMGNAATLFSTKGIGMDITPPTMSRGNVTFKSGVKNLCVPLNYEEDGKPMMIGFNFSVKE